MSRLAAWLMVGTVTAAGVAGFGCGRYGPPERTLPPEPTVAEPGTVLSPTEPDPEPLREKEGGGDLDDDGTTR
jgi:hypothetical protein